jgi:hypothetical protein
MLVFTCTIDDQASRRFAILLPQALFAVMVAGLIAAHMAGMARLAYAGGALAVGLYLVRLHPPAYVGFVLWLWLLTAFVRRLADLSAGWQEPSVVLLTPYLVTLLSVVPFVERTIRRQPFAGYRPAGLAMFGLVAAGTMTGLPLGFMSGPQGALLEALNYFTPLALGLYIAMANDWAAEIEERVIATFRYAALVVGLYGIYQFTVAPVWDTSWMVNSEMVTIGRPEPFGIRVFSTMHSPGVLGVFVAMALILWVARPTVTGIPAAAAASITLLLSQVRSAWLMFLIGAALVVTTLRPAQQLKAILLAVLALLMMGTLLVTPEMSEMVDQRMKTFEQIDEDTSGLARVMGHEVALELVTRRPLGMGIGQTDATIESYVSMRDSTIIAGLVQFGLVGALLYFSGLAVVLVHVWRYYRRAETHHGAALGCAGLALLAISSLGVMSAGPMGICFWLVAGLAVADRHRARLRAAAAMAAEPEASTYSHAHDVVHA